MNKSNYITLHAVDVAFINYYKVSVKFAFFFQLRATDKFEPRLQRYKKLMVFLEMYHVYGMEMSLSYISFKKN